MLLQPPDAVVADHDDDRQPLPHKRLRVHQREAGRPVAHQHADLPVGMGDPGAHGVPHAGTQAAVRAGIQPGTRHRRFEVPAGVGHEVPAVADHDRAAIDDLVELRVYPHRVERRPLVRQLGLLRGALLVLGLAQPVEPAGAVGAAGRSLAQRVERRRHPAVQLRRDIARMRVLGRAVDLLAC